MVTIAPRFDPGGDFGQAFGSGIGRYLEQQAEAYRQNQALDALDQLKNQQQPTSGVDVTKALLRATAGVPGRGSIIETLAPLLMKESQARAMFPQGDQSQPYEWPQDRGQQTQGALGALSGLGGAESMTGQQQQQMAPEMQQKIDQDLSMIDQRIQNDIGKSISNFPQYMQEGLGAWQVPSPQERAGFIAKAMISGAPYEQALSEYNAAQEQKKEAYLSKVTALNEMRNIEESQIEAFGKRINTTLEESGFTPDRFWQDAGLRIAAEERIRGAGNKTDTDEQIKQRTTRRLKDVLNLTKSIEEIGGPSWFKPVGYQLQLEDATEKWSNRFREELGDTEEVRDKAQTLMESRGWDKYFSHEKAWPFSKDLEKQIKVTPELAEEQTTNKMKRGDAVKLNENRMKQIYGMVPFLAKKIAPNDSILNMRNYLVEKKNLSVYQANQVVNAIAEKVNLTPRQSAQLNEANGSLVTMSLNKIFSGLGGRSFRESERKRREAQK